MNEVAVSPSVVAVTLRRPVGRQPRAHSVEAAARKHGDEDVETIQEHELGVFREVGDLAVVGGEVLLRSDPADVRPPTAVDHR